MASGGKPKYYLVESSMVPEIFIKVTEAKKLLETGQAETVADAVKKVGISRSAFYKYKDSVSPFLDMKQGQIISFQMMLRDETGVLSSVLSIFSQAGVNILTINQNIPINGKASVAISVESTDTMINTQDLINQLQAKDGVIKVEVLAG